MKRLLLAASLAALPAFAGPYDQPYVIITSDRAPAADPNLRYVIVNRVDGESMADQSSTSAFFEASSRTIPPTGPVPIFLGCGDPTAGLLERPAMARIPFRSQR